MTQTAIDTELNLYNPEVVFRDAGVLTTHDYESLIESFKQPTFYCPHCYQAYGKFFRVCFVNGQKLVKHFRHPTPTQLRPGEETSPCADTKTKESKESERHLNAKSWLKHHYEKREDVACVTVDKIFVKGSQAQDHKRKPDVLIEFVDGKKEGHEIQVSKISTESLRARTFDMRSAGVEPVWYFMYDDSKAKTIDRAQGHRVWLSNQSVKGYRIEFDKDDLMLEPKLLKDMSIKLLPSEGKLEFMAGVQPCFSIAKKKGRDARVAAMRQKIEDTIECSIFSGQGNPDITIPGWVGSKEVWEAWCQIKARYPEWWLKFDELYIYLDWGMSPEHYWLAYRNCDYVYVDPPKDEWQSCFLILDQQEAETRKQQKQKEAKIVEELRKSRIAKMKEEIEGMIEASILCEEQEDGWIDHTVYDEASISSEEICECWWQIRVRYPNWWLRLDRRYIFLEQDISAERYWHYYRNLDFVYVDPPKEEWQSCFMILDQQKAKIAAVVADIEISISAAILHGGESTCMLISEDSNMEEAIKAWCQISAKYPQWWAYATTSCNDVLFFRHSAVTSISHYVNIFFDADYYVDPPPSADWLAALNKWANEFPHSGLSKILLKSKPAA